MQLLAGQSWKVLGTVPEVYARVGRACMQEVAAHALDVVAQEKVCHVGEGEIRTV